MWSGPGKHGGARPAPLERAGEKREPLKSKNNEGLGSDTRARKKKVQGSSHEKEAGSEKPGAICPRTPAEPPVQRAMPVSESLVKELSQALLRMDMGLEQEYAYDIFSSMMKQPRYTFRGPELPRSVTAEMRALTLDWLVQVHEYLNLADDTLHLTVYLMNAYLKAGKVQVSRLQLLGIACLFLACKVEESTFPDPAQLCFLTEDSFARRELLRMERKVLARLQFELHYPSPLHLLRLLAEVGRCPAEVRHLAMYFLELSWMEVDCLCFEPAQLALAALWLAQRVLGWQAPQEGSPKLHLYSESELLRVHPPMAKAALQGASSSLRAIFCKYSRPQKLCISTSPAIAASDYLSRCLQSPAL
ncbi:cyclin-P isoform X2 [Hemicordylus capensis]|uniref:cyclin-P isoform X2 n=1 Tax=Hemicordylus capensis TaxID=884348 RepID=UPI0023038524|nr:cyclin-P isoform X2 [Hemicordylus capensis]